MKFGKYMYVDYNNCGYVQNRRVYTYMHVHHREMLIWEWSTDLNLFPYVSSLSPLMYMYACMHMNFSVQHVNAGTSE